MGKKPKLTPEEKKKLKAEKKIAKKLAIAEGKRKVKRDELAREIKYGELTRKKMEQRWQQMMMDIKLPQLQIEFQLAVNNVELMLDLKDFTISLLLDELDEAEEQYGFNLRSQCENIESLYKIYLSRLHTLKTDYETELSLMTRELHKEIDQLTRKSEEADTSIKTMIYQLACQEKHLVNMGRSMYMSKHKELEQKYKDELSLRKMKGEDKFEKIWKKYVKHLEGFNDQVNDIKKEYDERMDRDVTVVDVIRKQSKELFHLQNVLRITKEHQEIEKDRASKKMKDLLSEKEYYNEIFLTLKHSYEEDKKCDEKVLTHLVIESNENIKNLKKVELLVEKVLRFYTLVRKFETKREKILPFPKSLPKKLKVEYDYYLKQLSYFWQKCAVADTGRNNVHDEYLQLLEENHSLKHAVKSCLNYACNKKLPPITPAIATRLRGSSITDFIYKL